MGPPLSDWNVLTNVASTLSAGAAQIVQCLKPDKSIARLEARVIAAHAWNVSASWLIAHDTDALTSRQHAHFQTLLERRLGGEPIAYITGKREFFGRVFHVTPAVLIPRPETELLVETVLAQIPMQQPIDILELGTGNGCIAISLALERPHAQITATDKYEEALEVAKLNARNLGADQITFLKSDWFSALAHRQFDLIVSNPPYVAGDDAHLLRGDVRFEPRTALASGLKGMDDLAHLISRTPSFLKNQAGIYLEHGYDQTRAIAELLKQAGFSRLHTAKDLAGHDRVSSAILSE